MREKKHNPVIDVLRFVSILAVVLIHTTTRSLEASFYDLARLPWTLFLNQSARFAVPLFFMISGFVLELSYPFHQDYLSYLKKRISRIFVPYVFWSAIYYFFLYTIHKKNFFQALLTGDASYQLYFIPSLLIFYIIFPLIHRFYEYVANKFIIIFLGAVQFLILFYDYFVAPINLFYPVAIAILNFYIFFLGVILSHYLEDIVSGIKKWKIFLFLTTFLLALLVFYEGYNLYLKTHNYLMFYSQWRPSVFFYTIFVAGTLYVIFAKNFANLKIVKTVSKLSFFVFFIHVIILEKVWEFFQKSVFAQTHGDIARQIWYDPLFFAVVAVISFSIAFVAHKIPYLSKITG